MPFRRSRDSRSARAFLTQTDCPIEVATRDHVAEERPLAILLRKGVQRPPGDPESSGRTAQPMRTSSFENQLARGRVRSGRTLPQNAARSESATVMGTAPARSPARGCPRSRAAPGASRIEHHGVATLGDEARVQGQSRLARVGAARKPERRPRWPAQVGEALPAPARPAPSPPPPAKLRLRGMVKETTLLGAAPG